MFFKWGLRGISTQLRFEQMKKNTFWLALIAMAMAAGACHTPHVMTDISRSRILVDGRYDGHPDAEAAAFVEPYSRRVDSLMSPVVGSVARYMAAYKPESELSNLLADILMWTGKRYGERPDFAVYNMGGIRAAFAKGPVTLGNILDVAPFENKICFLTLTGANVVDLFRQMARRGGEGVSHGVELEMTRGGELLKVRINGKEVDPAGSYRVATLDYLAQGNDQLVAFKTLSDMKSPQGLEDNVRELIREFFKEQKTAGNVVDSQVEGRIKIVE